MLKALTITATAFATLLALTTIQAQAAQQSHATSYNAKITQGSFVVAYAEYQSRSSPFGTQEMLRVTVTNGRQNAKLPITVDGIFLDEVATDENGKGTLVLRYNSTFDPSDEFLGAFLGVHSSSKIRVGNAEGSFR